MKLNESTSLVTGASSGIGQAIGRAFAARGSHVILVSRREPVLEAEASAIRSTGASATAIAADVSDAMSIRAMVQRVASARGRIDVVVNNAGIGLISPVADLCATDLERVFAVNLFGPITLIQSVVPIMLAQHGGVIVNVLSINAKRSMPNSGAYSATKAALDMISESLRMELSGSGVKVVNVYPGFTRTPFGDNALGAKPKGRGKKFAVSPECVAQAVVKAVENECRDVYVTIADRLGVWLSRHFPSLADRAMTHFWRSAPAANPSNY